MDVKTRSGLGYDYQAMRVKVEDMVADLRLKIRQDVPDEGVFQMVYSVIVNTDSSLSLTHILLSFRPEPDHLPDWRTERWLELTGYRLPIPYKCDMLLFRGTTEETLRYLSAPEAVEKILSHIPRLDDNMMDV